MSDDLTKARATVLATLARDGVATPPRWRTVITDSESPTGVAPVCAGERSDALHMIDDYPGGPIRDEDGVYDCCPWPQFDTYSVDTAAYLVAVLNADAEPSVDHRVEARNEAADWFASYPFPSSDSDWERGRDDTVAWVVRTLRNPDPQRGTAAGQGLDARLDEHRTMVLAEVTAWLIKKAREFHAAGRKAERAQGDTCAVLASKIARGAVRPDNLRMLPNAGFFEVDHTYTDAQGFRFECHAVAPTPRDGTPRAIGYLTHPDGSGHVHGMTGEQWADGAWDDTTDTTTTGDHT